MNNSNKAVRTATRHKTRHSMKLVETDDYRMAVDNEATVILNKKTGKILTFGAVLRVPPYPR